MAINILTHCLGSKLRLGGKQFASETVYCVEFLYNNGKHCANAADITHVQRLPKICMLQPEILLAACDYISGFQHMHFFLSLIVSLTPCLWILLPDTMTIS
jgi:hypothetical protein